MFNGLSVDKTRRSYLFRTFGYIIPSEVRESSLIINYAIYLFLLKNLKFSLKIFENIFYSKSHLLRKNTSYIESFNSYIDNNAHTLADALVRFILAYTYQITNPSGTFLNAIVDRVEQKLHDLKKFFSESVSIKDSIASNTILYGSNVFYAYVAGKFTNSAADLSLGIFSNDLLETMKNFEVETYDGVMNKYSPQAFREYLYLVYYYKLNPKKFLNVLQMILLDYTKQNLVDYNQSIINVSMLQSYFYQLLGTINNPPKAGLNFSVIEELLSSIVTPQYILETIEQERIAEFAVRVEMLRQIEDIFSENNKEFGVFIDDVYETIFNYLKETTQTNPYYEFYFNRKMLFWYLSSCLKRDVLQNKVFMKEEIELSEIFEELLTHPDYSVSFNIEKMRSRTVQFIEGNITNIGNLFENIVETSIEKRLHNENITYFLN